MNINVSRVLYVNLLLLVGSLDWLIAHTHPEQNAGNWLAGIVGAFLLRLLIQVSARKHVTGWLVGSIAAFLWAHTLHARVLSSWEEYAVWGLVGFASDFILQIVVFILTYARDHPAEAFDQGLERVEKAATVWTKIKVPIMDFINQFSKK